jgi:hypothetical protein
LLNKLVILSGTPMPSAKLARRRERADVICEAVRALDATGMIRTFLGESRWSDFVCEVVVEGYVP